MSSFDEVFAAVKEYCKERLVLATYNLFIDGIEPVSFECFICTDFSDRFLSNYRLECQSRYEL